MTKSLTAVILAGRETTHPRSGTSLFLRNILGVPAVRLVLDAVRASGSGDIVAVMEDPRGDLDRWFKDNGVRTAPSLRRALRDRASGDALVIEACLPLIQGASLRALTARHGKSGKGATLLCPPGVSGSPDPEALACPVAVFKASVLRRIAGSPEAGDLGRLSAGRLVRLSGTGSDYGLSPARRLEELFEVRDAHDLAVAASMLRLRKIRDLARGGVAVLDPASTWIDLDVRIGPDTVISPSVIIEGKSRIGRRSRIMPNVRIADSTIGDDTVVRDFTVIESAVLERGAEAGPFSRLRPGTRIRAGAKVGNFVELKNTDFGRGSKALHLSYLGDSAIGGGVNIGAGTITCNYDGYRKNRTVIGEGVFIGSGTELVAPVRVGRKAYVAAGSTITKDVRPGSLAIARARQVEKPGWVGTREEKMAGKRRPRS